LLGLRLTQYPSTGALEGKNIYTGNLNAKKILVIPFPGMGNNSINSEAEFSELSNVIDRLLQPV